MTDSDKIKMYLNIGDNRFTLTVPLAQQDFVREVEKKVDLHYREWRRTFAGKTNREVLAMVAFQYASFYEDLLARCDQASATVAECLREIDADLEASGLQETESWPDLDPDY